MNDEQIDGKVDPVHSLISANDLSIKSKIIRNPDLGQMIVSACLDSKMLPKEKVKLKKILVDNKNENDKIFIELLKLNTAVMERLGLWFKEPEPDVSTIYIENIISVRATKAKQIIDDINSEYKINIGGDEDRTRARVHVRG